MYDLRTIFCSLLECCSLIDGTFHLAPYMVGFGATLDVWHVLKSTNGIFIRVIYYSRVFYPAVHILLVIFLALWNSPLSKPSNRRLQRLGVLLFTPMTKQADNGSWCFLNLEASHKHISPLFVLFSVKEYIFYMEL